MQTQLNMWEICVSICSDINKQQSRLVASTIVLDVTNADRLQRNDRQSRHVRRVMCVFDVDAQKRQCEREQIAPSMTRHL